MTALQMFLSATLHFSSNVYLHQHIQVEIKVSPFYSRYLILPIINDYFFIKISLTFVSMGPVRSIPTIVQILILHRFGGKLLFETMVA